MTNEMKLLRAFIEASGFDVTELDAVPCKAQPSTGDILYESAYKVTKKVTSANESWQERALRNWRTPES